jgi:hypothetical protein
MFENLSGFVRSDRVDELDIYLSRARVTTRAEFQETVRRISKDGHHKALEAFLYSVKFARRSGGSVEILSPNWLTYRTTALLGTTAPRSRFRALASIPSDANIPRPAALGTILGAIDEILRDPKGPVYLVTPFIDMEGVDQLRRIAAHIDGFGQECVLLIRFPPSGSPERRQLGQLLARLDASQIAVANYHHQQANTRFVSLSFHAKGVYLPDRCVVATMNYTAANLTRNIEFGIMIEGSSAHAYYQVVREMARASGIMSLEEAVENLASDL